MLYQLYESQRALMAPFAEFASASSKLYSHPLSPFTHVPMAQRYAAGFDLMHRLAKEYEKPEFEIKSTTVAGVEVAVQEQVALEKPFCRLLRFKRFTDHAPVLARMKTQPKVLVVAPLSGHHSTLLRDTVKMLLRDHKVFITDWTDARMVSLEHGPFHLDDYVGYVQEFIRTIGHDVSVISVCQPTVPVLAAVWRDIAPQRMREQQLQSALQQIEDHQAANLQLRREFGEQVMRDSATGLSTRAHFDDQLRREVDLSTREHREFAVVLVELDADSERVAALGSRAQDRVLEAMGRLLRGNTRAMDASCRLQARRFGVLLSGVGLATAHSRMEGLRRQCATQIVVLDGEELGFSVSMGVASFPHTAHSQDELLNACESALSEARKRGGNTVALASIRFDAASA